MKRVMHSELAHWLKTATQGLPKQEAAITEMELYSHYEDAVDDYRAQGKSAEEAHHQAMLDLGGAEVTSAGLRDVHLGTRRYTIASAMSLLVLLVLYGLPILFSKLAFPHYSIQETVLYTIFFGSLCVLSVTVMRAVKDLLTWRFNVRRLEAPFWLLSLGLSIYVITDVITLSTFRYAVGYGNGPSLFTLNSPIEIVLAVIAYLSQMAVAVGLMTFAARMQPVRNQLYGLGLPLSVLLGLLAIGVGGSATAVLIGDRIIETMLVFLENIAHTILWPVLVLLFYRAIYHRIQLPRQFA